MANLAVFNSAAFLTASQLAVAGGATIEVRREDTSALASIFSNEAGTAAITNPSAFADSSGRFSFYAAGIARGYSVLVTSGAESFTLRNVAIGTLAQLDAGNLGAISGTSVSVTGDVSGGSVSGNFVASQSAQETGTNTSLIVTPGRQKFHPTAAKAWVQYDSAAGLTSSYNVTSVTDNSAGNLSPVWATDFSSAAYCVVANHEAASSATAATTWTTQVLSRAAGGCNIATIRMSDFAQIDVTYVSVVAFGDQA